MTTWQNWIDNQGARVAAAEADAKHLRAVKILDAWLAKRGNYSLAVKRFRNTYYVRTRDGLEGCDFPPVATAAAARIAAADALANEDPSLLEGLE